MELGRWLESEEWALPKCGRSHQFCEKILRAEIMRQSAEHLLADCAVPKRQRNVVHPIRRHMRMICGGLFIAAGIASICTVHMSIYA